MSEHKQREQAVAALQAQQAERDHWAKMHNVMASALHMKEVATLPGVARLAEAVGSTRRDGVRTLIMELSTMESRAAYEAWRNHPTTQLFIRALRALAIHHPALSQQADLAAQYGVSQGVTISAQLLDDPESVLGDKVFSVRTPDEMDAAVTVAPGAEYNNEP